MARKAARPRHCITSVEARGVDEIADHVDTIAKPSSQPPQAEPLRAELTGDTCSAAGLQRPGTHRSWLWLARSSMRGTIQQHRSRFFAAICCAYACARSVRPLSSLSKMTSMAGHGSGVGVAEGMAQAHPSRRKSEVRGWLAKRSRTTRHHLTRLTRGPRQTRTRAAQGAITPVCAGPHIHARSTGLACHVAGCADALHRTQAKVQLQESQ